MEHEGMTIINGNLSQRLATMNQQQRGAGPVPDGEYESSLAKQLRERAGNRRKVEFDVSELLGTPGAKVWVRVPTKGEQDLAVKRAHEYVARLATGEGGEAIKDDADVTQDAKAAAILHAAIRGNDAGVEGMHPAFPSVRWIIEKLTADQIASLLSLVNEVRSSEPGGTRVLTDDEIEALVAIINKSELQGAQVALAKFQREALSHVVVVLATKLAAARMAAAMHDEAAMAAEEALEVTQRDKSPSDE
jgi:hypothetical protein